MADVDPTQRARVERLFYGTPRRPTGAGTVLRVQTLAEILDVHENTILTWINKDGLPAIKLKGSWRIQTEDAIDFVAAMQSSSTGEAAPAEE